MKYFLFTQFLLITLSSQAQNLYGEVTYGEKLVEIVIDTSKIEKDYIKDVIIQQMKATKKALSGDNELYILKFNEIESLFEPLPLMENDANPILKRVISQGVYYSNLSTCTSLHQLFIFGDTHIIKRTTGRFDWEITEKTKQINNHTCFLAFTKNEVRPGVFISIEAWFAPEIPLNHGPKGYGGLPGLILALKEKGHYFYAKKIRLNNKDIEIDKPQNGKIISEQEFHNMAKKSIEKMKKMRNTQ